MAAVKLKMERIKKMRKNICLALGILMTLVTGCDTMSETPEQNKLTSPPVPFVAQEISKTTSTVPELKEVGAWSKDFTKKFYKKTGIFAGNKALTALEDARKENWRDKERLLFIKSGDNVIGQFSFWGASEASFGSGFGKSNGLAENGKISLDEKEKSISFKQDFALDKDGNTGNYMHKAKVLPNGLIELDFAYTVPEGREKSIKDEGLFLDMPFKFCAGKTIEIDGVKYQFSNEGNPLTEKDKVVYSGKASKITFNPEDKADGFSLDLPGKNNIAVSERRLEKAPQPHRQKVLIRIKPIKRNVKLCLDIRDTTPATASSDTHCGIDFWKYDRLHVPDYGKCRNLIQNSSFEGGLRYYRFPSVGAYHKTEFDKLILADSSQAKFGNSSLLMRAFKKATKLQTFAIPVNPGKKYAVSFYAKADKPDLRFDLSGISAKWLDFPKMGSCSPGLDWKRYNFAFTAPNNAISILMHASYNGKDENGYGNIWIDGFQLEEGDLTDFASKPVSAELLTSSPDNFLQPKDPINAKLRISAVPEISGKVRLELEDFFYSRLWQGNFDFKTDKKGEAYIDLPLDGKLGTGIFVVRADFEMADGFRDTDYFRIAVMDFLEGKHKNRYITSCGIAMRNPRAVDVARRNIQIGIGGTDVYGINENTIALIKILNDFGVKNFSSSLKDKRDRKFKVMSKNWRELTSVTPELEKELEDASFEKAKEHYPLVDSWFFTGESTGHLQGLDRAGKIDDIAKLQIAAYKGVKRFNKNIKVLAEGGPCNMGARNGTLWLERLLQAEKKLAPDIKFDAVAIHPYRARPEDPDLDYETEEFLKMLNRNGYGDVPVIWNESIYHTHYVIPPWGLDTHKGCSSDHYRAYCPSYHMGWGERISAAYWMRHWLVGLKYQNRISFLDGHYSWNDMDSNLTPLAVQKTPNTLGNILGNAVFREDIRFAPNVRCYVFEDEKQRPVAAVWSHIADVDKGNSKCPEMEIRLPKETPQVFDMMGVERGVVVDSNGMATMPVSSFPIFVRGTGGSLKEFCSAFTDARLKGKEYMPLAISIQPESAINLKAQFRNLTGRNFSGTAEIDIQGKKTALDLNLKGQAEKTISLSLTEKILSSKISSISIPVSVTEKNRNPEKIDASFNAFATKELKGSQIKIDGNEEDWAEFSAIPVNNQFLHTGPRLGDPKLGLEKENIGYSGDFSASFKTAWDDDNFYLLVKVVDDKHCPAPGKTVWAGDSLQVYFDTYCDARLHSEKGFDTNDYNYDFKSDSENPSSLVAWRGFCPEWQLTLEGGLKLLPSEFEKNLKTAFKKTVDGYIYEIAFPKAYLAPMQLKKETCIGFSLFINDNDGGKSPKRSLTLTPDGTASYQNPHLYPVMILTE